MKTINVSFDDCEFEELLKRKNLSWRRFIIRASKFCPEVQKPTEDEYALFEM
jgi:hypothetical protein